MTDLTIEDDLDVEAEWEAAPTELAPDVDHEVADLDDRPIVVSAFAGIGGLDSGFELAGMQTAVQIEWDAAASRVLAARFPHATRFGDVRHVTAESVRRAVQGRHVHVLCGGFPCQDLSVAGRRAGLAGARSGLYGELLRLAQELDPDWLVVENVPGLLSADADPEVNDGAGYGPGSAFALFLGDVTGYRPPVPENGWRNSGVCHGPLGTAAWRVLDARYFGVAQRRRRVFVVVNTRDRAAPAAVLLEPQGMRWDPAARRPSWARAAASAVGAAVRRGFGGADRDGEAGAQPADDMTPTWVPEVSVPLGSLSGGQRQDLDGMTYVPVATNALDGDVARALVAQGSSDPNDYSQSTYVAVEDRGIGHIEASGGDDLAPTVTSKWAKGRGGPAGSETGNLIVEGVDTYNGDLTGDVAHTVRDGHHDGVPAVTVVGDGGTEVSHPVTASGTDGMGRGVPAVAYGISSDALDRSGEGAAGDAASRSGLGIVEEASPTLRTRAQAVAYGVAMRGREEGNVPELTEELVSGLRASSGGSTRDLVLPPGVEVPDGYEVLVADDLDDEVAARLAAGGAVAFDWQAGGNAADDSFRGKARAWIVKKGDYAGALSTSKVQAVAYIVDKERGIPNDEGIRVEETDVAPPLLADGDPAERTDRGTRIVQPVSVNANQDPIHEVDGTGPVQTANGQAGTAVSNHAAVRRLTPRECERLQGFPDDWTLVLDAKGKLAADSPRYKQLGNAVCVNVAEWVACRILAYDEGQLG